MVALSDGDELLGQTGDDGLGPIWSARAADGTPLVVRVASVDPAGLRRLRREKGVLAGLTSRYVVSWREVVLDTTDPDAPQASFVMAAPAVETLAAELAGGLHLDAGAAARIGADLALGLVALHAAGLTHGAIGPDQVYRDGEPGRGSSLPQARLAGAGVAGLRSDAQVSESGDVAAVADLVRTLAGDAVDETLAGVLGELTDGSVPHTAREAATKLAAQATRLASGATASPPAPAPVTPTVAAPTPAADGAVSAEAQAASVGVDEGSAPVDEEVAPAAEPVAEAEAAAVGVDEGSAALDEEVAPAAEPVTDAAVPPEVEASAVGVDEGSALVDEDVAPEGAGGAPAETSAHDVVAAPAEPLAEAALPDEAEVAAVGVDEGSAPAAEGVASDRPLWLRELLGEVAVPPEQGQSVSDAYAEPEGTPESGSQVEGEASGPAAIDLGGRDLADIPVTTVPLDPPPVAEEPAPAVIDTVPVGAEAAEEPGDADVPPVTGEAGHEIADAEAEGGAGWDDRGADAAPGDGAEAAGAVGGVAAETADAGGEGDGAAAAPGDGAEAAGVAGGVAAETAVGEADGGAAAPVDAPEVRDAAEAAGATGGVAAESADVVGEADDEAEAATTAVAGEAESGAGAAPVDGADAAGGAGAGATVAEDPPPVVPPVAPAPEAAPPKQLLPAEPRRSRAKVALVIALLLAIAAAVVAIVLTSNDSGKDKAADATPAPAVTSASAGTATTAAATTATETTPAAAGTSAGATTSASPGSDALTPEAHTSTSPATLALALKASDISTHAKPLTGLDGLDFNSLIRAAYAYCDYYSQPASTRSNHVFVGYSTGVGINLYDDVATYAGNGAQNLVLGVRQTLSSCSVLAAQNGKGQVLGTYHVSATNPLQGLPSSQVGLLYQRVDQSEPAVQAVFIQVGDRVVTVLAQGQQPAQLGGPLDRAAKKALARIPATG